MALSYSQPQSASKSVLLLLYAYLGTLRLAWSLVTWSNFTLQLTCWMATGQLLELHQKQPGSLKPELLEPSLPLLVLWASWACVYQVKAEVHSQKMLLTRSG